MRRLLLLTLAGPLLAAAPAASAQELDRYGGGADYVPAPAPQVQRASYTPAAPGLMGAPMPAGPTRFLSWSGKSAGPVQPEPPRAPPPQPVARYVPPPPPPAAPPPAPRRIEPAPVEIRPVLQANRAPSRPWTEWRRAAAQPTPAATPGGWAPFDPAALSRRDPGRSPARRAPSQAQAEAAASARDTPSPAARRTIYDPAPPVRSRAPAPTASAAPLPAAPTVPTAYDSRGVRHYSLHREFGMKPDPTPIPPQFFTATADLSGGEPAGPDPVVGTGKAAAATRARVAAASDPS